MTDRAFFQLNDSWNAEPNDPAPEVQENGSEVTLRFRLNPWAYEAATDEQGLLTFDGCSEWSWAALMMKAGIAVSAATAPSLQHGVSSTKLSALMHSLMHRPIGDRLIKCIREGDTFSSICVTKRSSALRINGAFPARADVRYWA